MRVRAHLGDLLKISSGVDLIWSEATAPPSKPLAQTRHIIAAMSETSGEIKSLLESLLTCFEASQIAADKHVEAQLAFNQQVSSDLTHLRKQVDLTRSDVDEVRQQRDQPRPTAPPSPRHQPRTLREGDPQASFITPPEQPHGSEAHASYARLANMGQPLIETRPHAPLTGATQAAQHHVLHQQHHEAPLDNYTVKPPKHDFPRCSRGMELQPDAPPASVPSDSRDWSELPLDALTLVFARLGAVDVLMGAGLVCHSWLEAAKAPELWRKVEMDFPWWGAGDFDFDYPWNTIKDMRAMAKVAVDRSNGKLEVFVGKTFVTDEILNYIGDRSPSLKGLELVSCDKVTSEGFTDLLNKCPLLEYMEVSDCEDVRGDAIVATDRACLRLRHLRLVCNEITNEELMAIVDICPCLEYLSVVNCCDIVVDDALRAKCAAIKTLELPTSENSDEMSDYGFYETGQDFDHEYDYEYEG